MHMILWEIVSDYILVESYKQEKKLIGLSDDKLVYLWMHLRQTCQTTGLANMSRERTDGSHTTICVDVFRHYVIEV